LDYTNYLIEVLNHNLFPKAIANIEITNINNKNVAQPTLLIRCLRSHERQRLFVVKLSLLARKAADKKLLIETSLRHELQKGLSHFSQKSIAFLFGWLAQ
jgi:hypothetical protein